MIYYSIIIPHKNIPNLLERCLNTIPCREDLEIIIVDDNSDSTIVNFSNFPGKDRIGVKIVFTNEGKGAGYARNVGLNNAIGRWIIFADADDFFVDGFLNVINHYRDADADVIFFKSVCRMSSDLSVYGNRQNLCEEWGKMIESYNAGRDVFHDLTVSMCVPWGKMVRRKFLHSNKIRFEEIPYSNDVMWSTNIVLKLNQDRFIASPDVLYCLTERPASLTSLKSGNIFLCRFNVLLRQHELLKNNFIESNINFIYYFSLAQEYGLIVLIKAMADAVWQTTSIPPVYEIEKKFHFKYPLFYMIILILQTIKNRFL